MLADRLPDRSFAEEVYASCATIGYSSATVRSLKIALDTPGDADKSDLLDLATRAQAEAVRWAAGHGEQE